MKTMKIAIVFALAFGTLHAQNLKASSQRYFNTVRQSLEASADLMPADKYNYRLTEGQMTFAEWLIHSAQRNNADCAIVAGETAPPMGNPKTKEEVSKALKDSFTYCAAVLDKTDDAEGASRLRRSAYAFLHIIVHNNEIYGNIVGYMRSSGLVPPSTAAKGAPKKK